MRLAAALLLATAAAAQDLPAVGRITYGEGFAPGAAVCTGALVAPDLVLTAGHCVAGSAETPGIIRFAAGYGTGAAAALGRGAAVMLAAGQGVPADVALVRLAAPLPVAPLPTGPETDPWLTRVGYRRDAPEAPETVRTCLRLQERDGVLHLDCRAVSGNSGAPVLSRGPGGDWRIAAVMVGTLGAQGSVAVRIPQDLAAVISGAAGRTPGAP